MSEERECMYCLEPYTNRENSIEHIIENHGFLIDEMIDDTFVEKEEG